MNTYLRQRMKTKAMDTYGPAVTLSAEAAVGHNQVIQAIALIKVEMMKI